MICLRAPAKLNLYLRVLGRRADGYHELETLFERIDLADEITLTPHSRGITVSCDNPTLDCGPENLVTRAASLLQQITGLSQGVAIHLTKRIPIASGLGGGSSDAATALVGLNQLWGLGLSQKRLVELASQLGSDVPFFLGTGPFAIGRGRGEQRESLVGKAPTLWHVLVVPQQRLSTQEIYAQLDARRASESSLPRPFSKGRDLTDHAPSITMCLHALRNGSLGELAKGLYNALEPEAIRRCPVITEIQARLRDSGAVGVLVSGSGPAIFGLCRDAAHAQRAVHRLQARGSGDWFVRVVKTEILRSKIS